MESKIYTDIPTDQLRDEPKEIARIWIDQLPYAKREYFAAMAMQGEMVAGCSDFNDIHVCRIAKISVAMADALIEELNKPTP